MAHHQASPFDDPANPFQDPSITQALNSTQQETFEVEPDPSSKQHHQHHDEYTSFQQYSDSSRDPFAPESTTTKTLISEPSNGSGSPSSSDLEAREAALRQKERELAAREANLDIRQRPHANNFPPCFPIMYLDIPAEIPLEHQSTVWWLYREWLLFELTLVINFVACLCLLFSHPASVTSAPTDLGVALTEMFTHTLASFFLWYRPVYNAYMKEVSLYYFFYFVFNGFHILYTFYKAVGIPSTGGAGLILVVTLFTDGYIITGILALLAAICWISMGVLAVFLYLRTYKHYKAAGHTFKEAKEDAYGRIGRSTGDAAINMAWNGRR
ncbi:hypothetical protein VTP01DRAFT_3762 [Rhizomucor pusillus]|uniref:uncharacterized protein n=1 Tax=Rhizomucor pusillus TaxID=4840 RepID=UPI0037422BFF